VILSREHTVAVSAVTIREIEIKRELGKLEAPTDLVDQLSTRGFLELPIEWEHALTAGRLPPHHRDPFDRMLIAPLRRADAGSARLRRYCATGSPWTIAASTSARSNRVGRSASLGKLSISTAVVPMIAIVVLVTGE
jgi:hypothetical protein